MQTFLVFVRSDRHPWMIMGDEVELSSAVEKANKHVQRGDYDRAVVMEVSGVDAMPMFTFKYGTKK